MNAVTSGGDQNAADGGIDVRISLERETKSLDFIPRKQTGFQVKLPDMPASAIHAEMRPNEALRDLSSGSNRGLEGLNLLPIAIGSTDWLFKIGLHRQGF